MNVCLHMLCSERNWAKHEPHTEVISHGYMVWYIINRKEMKKNKKKNERNQAQPCDEPTS